MKNYYLKRNKFTCPKCDHTFMVAPFWRWLVQPHLFDIWRYVKCPICCEKSWMKRIK